MSPYPKKSKNLYKKWNSLEGEILGQTNIGGALKAKDEIQYPHWIGGVIFECGKTDFRLL